MAYRLLNGPGGWGFALGRKWVDRRENYKTGYDSKMLAQIRADVDRAAPALDDNRLSDLDESAATDIHIKTARDLLGIPFNTATRRFAADLLATDPDAPEVVVDEFRVLLRVAEVR